ncbi:hypothetical protein LSH36_334g04009 [Paralvinella palmiformis]|uniref:Uncharacterized protein n=1 Tax=Paralvinella palmiformis TaxID=53620 RepID=A0AAD9JFL9_9ANNE|nr:hypothetical protein LSH36_334g04009 [Paralvinella palmiformis]
MVAPPSESPQYCGNKPGGSTRAEELWVDVGLIIKSVTGLFTAIKCWFDLHLYYCLYSKTDSTEDSIIEEHGECHVLI